MMNNGKLYMYNIKWDMQPSQRNEQRAALRSIKGELEQILGKHLAWDGKVYSTISVPEPFSKTASAGGANFYLTFE